MGGFGLGRMRYFTKLLPFAWATEFDPKVRCKILERNVTIIDIICLDTSFTWSSIQPANRPSIDLSGRHNRLGEPHH